MIVDKPVSWQLIFSEFTERIPGWVGGGTCDSIDAYSCDECNHEWFYYHEYGPINSLYDQFRCPKCKGHKFKMRQFFKTLDKD